uniref:Uncharacterized protein n=1 Tax=Anopheles coluzzii TaxID=1518534 RepID=A0A8W7PY66_ANOCL
MPLRRATIEMRHTEQDTILAKRSPVSYCNRGSICDSPPAIPPDAGVLTTFVLVTSGLSERHRPIWLCCGGSYTLLLLVRRQLGKGLLWPGRLTVRIAVRVADALPLVIPLLLRKALRTKSNHRHRFEVKHNGERHTTRWPLLTVGRGRRLTGRCKAKLFRREQIHLARVGGFEVVEPIGLQLLDVHSGARNGGFRKRAGSSTKRSRPTSSDGRTYRSRRVRFMEDPSSTSPSFIGFVSFAGIPEESGVVRTVLYPPALGSMAVSFVKLDSIKIWLRDLRSASCTIMKSVKKATNAIASMLYSAILRCWWFGLRSTSFGDSYLWR